MSLGSLLGPFVFRHVSMQPLDPFRFVLIGLAGWFNQHQQNVIDYLLAENRVLSDQPGSKRLRLSDGQRRRLARPRRSDAKRCPKWPRLRWTLCWAW